MWGEGEGESLPASFTLADGDIVWTGDPAVGKGSIRVWRLELDVHDVHPILLAIAVNVDMSLVNYLDKNSAFESACAVSGLNFHDSRACESSFVFLYRKAVSYTHLRAHET